MTLKRKLSLWLPAIVWCAFIFVLSSLPGADFSSDGGKNFVIRKLLHLVEYSVLGLAFYRGTKRPFLSAFLAIIYAISDEAHQTFVLGRTGKFEDVFIDSFASVLTGLVLWKFLHLLPRKLESWLKE